MSTLLCTSLFPDSPSALSVFHSLLTSPRFKSRSSKAINFFWSWIIHLNAAISHSHRAFGDFDVGILQNSIHSFCHTDCQWSPRQNKKPNARRKRILPCRKPGEATAVVTRLTCTCPECHAHSWCLAWRHAASQRSFVTACPLSVFNQKIVPSSIPLCIFCNFTPHPPKMCLCVCFCASSQGLTRHDAVDQITATGGERHQHYHSWLCGARRIHQRRHHPQLSPGRRWRRRHLRACREGRQGAQSPLPLLWSVLSLFSLWHLFQEGSCTASFTLFRATVNREIEWQKDDWGVKEVGMRRNDTGVWLEHEENKILFVSYSGMRIVSSSEMFISFTSHAVKK